MSSWAQTQSASGSNPSKETKMGSFILGILITLAVLYPSVTKTIFSKAVDTTHTVVSGAIGEAQKADFGQTKESK